MSIRGIIHLLTASLILRFFSIYQNLYGLMRTKAPPLKRYQAIMYETACLAWITDTFELYCMAEQRTPQAAVAADANVLVRWVKEKENDLFIIGGAVSRLYIARLTADLLSFGILLHVKDETNSRAVKRALKPAWSSKNDRLTLHRSSKESLL